MKQLAGFWPRLMAHNIDLLVMLPIYYLVSLMIDSNQWLLWICVLITYLYEVLSISSDWQGTVGKRVMHLKVTRSNGEKLTIYRSLLRSFTKSLTMMSLFIGYLIIIVHKRKQGIHDMIADTKVFLQSNS